jgi:hypothetical protein
MDTDNWTVDADFIQVLDFDPGYVVVDSSRMEESAGAFTSPAAGALADVDSNHL